MMMVCFVGVFIALIPRLLLFAASLAAKTHLRWAHFYWHLMSWLLLFSLTIYFVVGHNDLVDKTVLRNESDRMAMAVTMISLVVYNTVFEFWFTTILASWANI